MNKSRLMQVSLAALALALPTIGCAPSGNTNTVTTNTATPESTPDKTAIVAEITRIENDWPRVIKERDGAAVRRIEADDVVIIYPDGSLGGKEQDIKDIEAGNLTYSAWDISELNVKVLDADSAVASLLMSVQDGKYKAPDGKTRDISGRYRSVDTFARRNAQWQIVSSATVPVLGPAPPSATGSPTPRTSPPAKASPTRRPPPPPPANQ